MTNLGCSVETCGYNRDCCCCRSDINVEGAAAQCKDDTCCGSFKELSAQATNNVNTPNSALNVSCDAVNCVYNESHKCTASEIQIAGSSACKCEQTLCSSFEAK